MGTFNEANVDIILDNLLIFQADHRRAWGDESDRELALTGKPLSGPSEDEGPFQPTNHSGTQINVYHGPPGVLTSEECTSLIPIP